MYLWRRVVRFGRWEMGILRPALASPPWRRDSQDCMVARARLDPRQPDMGRNWRDMIKRGIKKPPHYIVQRILHEVWGQAERYVAPRRALQLSAIVLAKQAGYSST